MCKHACTRGVWGHDPPDKFLKLVAVRLLLRPYLYSNLYLDSMPLEYRAQVFLEHRSPCSGIAEPSLHRVPATEYGQKGHRTRQFEGGGALKGKSLPRGGTRCPWCPPPPPRFHYLCSIIDTQFQFCCVHDCTFHNIHLKQALKPKYVLSKKIYSDYLGKEKRDLL